MFRSPLRGRAAVLALCVAVVPAVAQLATVDVSDTSDPYVSYDPDPNLALPPLPDDPTVIYAPDPEASANGILSAAAAQNAVGVAAIALSAEGLVASTATYETDPLTSQQPTVTTSDPDTTTLAKPSVYYLAPQEPLGPFKAPKGTLRFDFGPVRSTAAAGYTLVTNQTTYSSLTGYGWYGDLSTISAGDNGGTDPAARTWCKVKQGKSGVAAKDAAAVSPTPFYVDVPNGYYMVSILSAPVAAGMTNRLSVWAEGGPEIVLNSNKTTGAWNSFPVRVDDGRLMLEFFNSLNLAPSTDPNSNTAISAVVIEPTTPDARPVVYVASDSTAASYGPSVYPLTGWGARLGYYFNDNVVIANHAIAGESSKRFFEARYLRTIETRMKPGDFLFVMFAINDSADDNSNRKTSPSTSFKAYLRQYVKAARDQGATPVFVTSQTKRTYDLFGRFTNSVQGYPQAMRELGAELGVPVLDLNRKSIDFLDAIGVEASADVYMFFDAGKYPGYPNGRADYIHLQDTGATAYAGLICQAIREVNLQPLADNLLDTPRPTENGTRSPY